MVKYCLLIKSILFQFIIFSEKNLEFSLWALRALRAFISWFHDLRLFGRQCPFPFGEGISCAPSFSFVHASDDIDEYLP